MAERERETGGPISAVNDDCAWASAPQISDVCLDDYFTLDGVKRSWATSEKLIGGTDIILNLKKHNLVINERKHMYCYDIPRTWILQNSRLISSSRKDRFFSVVEDLDGQYRYQCIFTNEIIVDKSNPANSRAVPLRDCSCQRWRNVQLESGASDWQPIGESWTCS